MTLISTSFFNNASRTPDKLAVWCEGETITYAKLADFVKNWAGALLSRGVRRGDSIGVLIPNSIEFAALILTAAELGVVLVPMNNSLPVSAIKRSFEATKVKHVFAASNALKPLLSSRPDTFKFIEGLWLSTDDEITGVETVSNLLKDSPSNYKTTNLAKDSDPLILTMTSGSTGDPKPIILNQVTKYNRAMAAIEMYGVTNEDRVLAATPMYHSLAERLVLIPLLSGGTSIIMARYSPSEWLKCVSEQFVSFTIAVSSQLKSIVQLLDNSSNTNKIASLRCVVSSSERLATDVKNELLSKLHCQFHECYGTSEIAIASNLNYAVSQGKLDSVGKPAPGVDIKILRQNGEIANPGETGEIICKTPMIFGGYFNRPDLTTHSMWGDYFRTADMGTLDSDGYLYFQGRIKDIIITGGINVYPKDIETALYEHPSVLECAAFPLPDEHLGEIIAVAIIPRNFEDFDKRKVQIHCAEHLADYQQPRKYFLLSELPKNAMGKVMKKLLPDCCLIE